MPFKGVMLMKEDSLKRVTYCMISFIGYSQKVKTTGTERSVVVRGQDCGGGCDCKGVAQGSLGHDVDVLYPDCGGGYMNLYMC